MTTPVGATNRTMNPGLRAPSPAQYATLLDSQRVEAYREAVAAVERARVQREARRRLLAEARVRRRSDRAAQSKRARLLRELEAELALVRLEMFAVPDAAPVEVLADRVRRAALVAHPEWALEGPARLARATVEAEGWVDPKRPRRGSTPTPGSAA